MTEVHSCSYHCERPECIKAQRDELRDRLGSMTDREIMQQALEGLEAAYEGQIWLSHLPDLSTALRERLAQPEQSAWNPNDHYNDGFRDGFIAAHPEQKPVAHTLNCICGAVWGVSPDGFKEMVHAPKPPQRTWAGSGDLEDSNAYVTPPQRQPLTDEEIVEGRRAPWGFNLDPFTAGVRFAESAHGIKGGSMKKILFMSKIIFHNGDKKVGELDFSGPELEFSGSVHYSARIFFKQLAVLFANRLEQDRNAERESLAKFLGEMADDMEREQEPTPMVKWMRSKAAEIRARGNT